MEKLTIATNVMTDPTLGYIHDIPYIVTNGRRVYLLHPNSSLVLSGCKSNYLGTIKADSAFQAREEEVYFNGQSAGNFRTWLDVWAAMGFRTPDPTMVEGLDTHFPRLNTKIFSVSLPFLETSPHFREWANRKGISKGLSLPPARGTIAENIKSRGGIRTYYPYYVPGTFPRAKWNGQLAKKLPNIHMGQDKLLFSEIEFLLSLGAPKKKVLVIYPGGGPGTHLPLLSEMMGCKIIAIDPAFSNARLKPIGPSDNIYIVPTLFDVGKWLDLVDRDDGGFDEIVMISDIRSEPDGVPKNSPKYAKLFDEEIVKNMKMQSEWLEAINEKRLDHGEKTIKGLFKFRLTYEEGSTKYLAGTLAFQVFEKQASTELRLWADVNAPKETYDHRQMEEELFFFNSRYRPGKFFDEDPIFGSSYDILKASKIIRHYFTVTKPGLSEYEMTKRIASFFFYLDDYFKDHRRSYYRGAL